MMNIATRIQAFSCPCCGGHIGEAAPIQSIIESERSWMSQAILEALSRPVGKRMRRDALIEVIYQLEDEPDSARTSFAVALSKLRKRLAVYGWTIICEGSKGPSSAHGAMYRLMPVEASP